MRHTILLGTLRPAEVTGKSGDVVLQKVKMNGITMTKIFQRNPQWSGFEAISRAWDRLCGNRNLTAELKKKAQEGGGNAIEHLKAIENGLQNIKVNLEKLESGSEVQTPFFDDRSVLKEILQTDTVEKVYVKRQEHFLPGLVQELFVKINPRNSDTTLNQQLKLVDTMRSFSPNHQYTHAERNALKDAILVIRLQMGLSQQPVGGKDHSTKKLQGLLREVEVRVEENLIGMEHDALKKEIDQKLNPQNSSSRNFSDEITQLLKMINSPAQGPRQYQTLRFILADLAKHWSADSALSTAAKQELAPGLLRLIDEYSEFIKSMKDSDALPIQPGIIDKLRKAIQKDLPVPG